MASIHPFARWTLLGAAAALAAGCATQPPPAPPAQPDPARVALEKSIQSGSRLPAHSNSADVPAAQPRMSGSLITIRSYVGDAANLLSRVAKARGMQFVVNGPEPRLPLFVAVDVTDVTFEDLATNVGHQFGQRADLVLGNNRIEIRYRGQP